VAGEIGLRCSYPFEGLVEPNGIHDAISIILILTSFRMMVSF